MGPNFICLIDSILCDLGILLDLLLLSKVIIILNIKIVTSCEHLILISTSGLRHTLEFILRSQPSACLFGDHHHWHTLPKHDIL